MSTPFPERHRPLIEGVAKRAVTLQREKLLSDDGFVRELLIGFYDLCVEVGSEGTLTAIHAAFPHTPPAPAPPKEPPKEGEKPAAKEPPTIREGVASGLKTLAGDPRFVPETLTEHPGLRALLLQKVSDTGGKPEAIAEVLATTFALEFKSPVGPPPASLPDAVRTAITTTVKSEFERSLAPGMLRSAILRRLEGERIGRTRAFKAMSPMVDDWGGPPAYADVVFRHSELEAQQITNMYNSLDRGRALAVEEACRSAIDATKRILQESSAGEVAERIDRPVSHKLTCFDVSVQRVLQHCGPIYEPAAVTTSLLESLALLVPIEWQAPDPSASPLKQYAPTVRFSVGDRVGHKSFGEGIVVSCTDDRVVVDFSGERRTLVHGR